MGGGGGEASQGPPSDECFKGHLVRQLHPPAQDAKGLWYSFNSEPESVMW